MSTTVSLVSSPGETWLSRERAAGYDPDVLQRGRGLLGGAGAGANNAALTLGLSQLGELSIADFDEYESHNATRSPFYPTADEIAEFGRAKARVLAEKVARLSRVVPGAAGTRTGYFRGYVQQLPAAVFQHVDFVLNGADNTPARAFLAEHAFLAGRPFIDAGFRGTLLQVGVFVPGDPATDPCWRCRYPSHVVNSERLYSCDRFARRVEQQGLVPSVQATAQVAGAMQAAQALDVLHGVTNRANSVFTLDIARGDSSSFRSVRNPACPSRWHQLAGHEPHPVHVSRDLTWEGLLEEASVSLGTDVQLEPLTRLVERMQCAACRRPMRVYTSAWLYEATLTCRSCGGLFPLVPDEDAVGAAETFYEFIDFTRVDLLPQPLAAFGQGSGNLLFARPFGEPGARPILVRLDGDAEPIFHPVTSDGARPSDIDTPIG